MTASRAAGCKIMTEQIHMFLCSHQTASLEIVLCETPGLSAVSTARRAVPGCSDWATLRGGPLASQCPVQQTAFRCYNFRTVQPEGRCAG